MIDAIVIIGFGVGACILASKSADSSNRWISGASALCFAIAMASALKIVNQVTPESVPSLLAKSVFAMKALFGITLIALVLAMLGKISGDFFWLLGVIAPMILSALLFVGNVISAQVIRRGENKTQAIVKYFPPAGELVTAGNPNMPVSKLPASSSPPPPARPDFEALSKSYADYQAEVKTCLDRPLGDSVLQDVQGLVAKGNEMSAKVRATIDSFSLSIQDGETRAAKINEQLKGISSLPVRDRTQTILEDLKRNSDDQKGKLKTLRAWLDELDGTKLALEEYIMVLNTAQ